GVESSRITSVEEAPGAVTHEPKAGPHQREGDDKGDHGVEPGDARQVDEAEAHHDTRAGQEVGQDVLPVGHERQRPIAAARAHEIPAENEIHETGEEDDEAAHAELADFGPGEEAPADLVHDDHGRERDQPAPERRREELDLAMAIGMVAIGGAPGKDEAADREE